MRKEVVSVCEGEGVNDREMVTCNTNTLKLSLNQSLTKDYILKETSATSLISTGSLEARGTPLKEQADRDGSRAGRHSQADLCFSHLHGKIYLTFNEFCAL